MNQPSPQGGRRSRKRRIAPVNGSHLALSLVEAAFGREDPRFGLAWERPKAMNATTIGAHREWIRALHLAGTFVIPNPWDAGTAKILASLGFPALATTSAGMAWTKGRPDSDASRTNVVAHVARIVGAVDLPIDADYEAGLADDPSPLAESVTACAAAGVSGLSIEDKTQLRNPPLCPFDLAVRRIEASGKAVKGTGVMLKARCEAHLMGWPNADAEILRRLPAFEEAGADGLYPPGLRTKAQIEAAIGGLIAIAWKVSGPSTFTSLAKTPPFAEIDRLFRTEGKT